MGLHSSGWFSYISHDDQKEQPAITRELLDKVWNFARPYWVQVTALLITILVISGISLISPLLYRDLIDVAIPERNFNRINWLALGMIGIPIISGVIGVWQRRLNAAIGEGVIFDLQSDGQHVHIKQALKGSSIRRQVHVDLDNLIHIPVSNP